VDEINIMQNAALPTQLYNTAQTRELDKLTQKKLELKDHELMERAGFVAFQTIKEIWPAARHIVVATGSGNNGGDGFVLARLAHQEGLAVRVLTVGDPLQLKGDALNAYQHAATAGVLISPFDAEQLVMADVIVDALLGTGIRRKVDGVFADAIHAINDLDIPVLAIDIPSGLCADTGRVYEVAIHADVTITFITMKLGLCTGSAADYVGEISFSDLGAPEALYEKVLPAAHLINAAQIASALPARKRTANKGDFGHVLVIGGDYGFAGAVSMSAIAALRVGAGLVSVATRPEHVAPIVARHPEIMAHGIRDVSELTVLLERATIIVLGPGLGKSEWSHQLWLAAIAAHQPMVVDADGLNLLAQDPHVSRDWILTPHPGEAARLLKTQVERIQLDRFAAVYDLQHQYGGIAVLKGSGTIIHDEEATPYVCTAGNPGMATGGMGDILSGVIAGLVAQKFSLSQAAQIGVYIHARAADLAARQGERGMIATDLLPYIHQLVNPS
jgi:hydroxyethylthiazole kinase-like uncharacterized protein yjeF